jgi:two-component system LytT family response regulator
VLNGAKDIVASKNIKEFEDTLISENGFVRVHRSYLLNLSYVQRYNKTEGGSVEMKTGQQLPVSKKLKDELIEKMTG